MNIFADPEWNQVVKIRIHRDAQALAALTHDCGRQKAGLPDYDAVRQLTGQIAIAGKLLTNPKRTTTKQYQQFLAESRKGQS